MRQYDQRNLSMVMDFYEMTMSNGYFNTENADTRVAFDVFYRKNPDNGGFAIFAGLEQIIEYINDLHFSREDISYLREQGVFGEEFLEYLANFRFQGDIYAFREGTIMYPGEPVITVVAPLIDAQLVETAILLQVNHQSLIATKARRIVKAARGRAVSDFGARRAHNMDAAVYGARACCIGGAVGTATVLAGKMFDIPISGTMAHSWVMFYNDEFEAFKKVRGELSRWNGSFGGYVRCARKWYPECDPCRKKKYWNRWENDFWESALTAATLPIFQKKARKMLDDAGLTDCKIVVSNSLDEFTINSLLEQGACIDSFGVGERMITSKSEPVFGAVYKMAAVEENGKFVPRIKVSENIEKITNPGLKRFSASTMKMAMRWQICLLSGKKRLIFQNRFLILMRKSRGRSTALKTVRQRNFKFRFISMENWFTKMNRSRISQTMSKLSLITKSGVRSSVLKIRIRTILICRRNCTPPRWNY